MNSMNSGQRWRSAQVGARGNDARGFQIGPRIRIGGSVGNAAQKLKEGTGKVLSNKYVGMGLSLVPGVGPGLAAAANMAGHAMDTSDGGINDWGDIGTMAKDAAMVYGGGKALGGVKSLLGSKVPIGEKLKGLVMRGGGSDGKGNWGVAGDLAGKLGGDDGLLDSLVGHGKDIVGGLGGGQGLVDKTLLAGAVAAAAADRQKQSQMIDEAKGYATKSYNDRAPLRTRALAAFADPSSAANKPADLSTIFSNPGSVYNKVGPRVPAVVQ